MKKQKAWFITGAFKAMELEVVKTVLTNGAKVIATSQSLDEQPENISGASENLRTLKVDIICRQE